MPAWSRRALLAAGLSAVGAGVVRGRQQPSPTTVPQTRPPEGKPGAPVVLRVGVLQPPEAIGSGWSEALGIQLGAEETARTAALLGASVEWSAREPGARDQAASEAARLAGEFRAHAIVAALDAEAATAAAFGAARAGVVFLPLSGPPAADGEKAHALRFTVPLLAEARRRAVAQALAQAGVPASEVRVVPQGPGPGAAVAATLWASEWDSSLQAYGADQLNQRFALRFARPMDGRAWCGWAAVKALVEAALRARPRTPAELAAALVRTGFDGHKGQSLAFRADDHVLQQPAYVVGRLPADGTGAPRVVAEVQAEEIHG